VLVTSWAMLVTVLPTIRQL